jgi:glucokinase
MLLAGDVGGTKTLLGLFERGERRPHPIVVRSYPTMTFPSFAAMLDRFARDVGEPFTVDSAAAGVAGPVVGNTARLTNIAWNVTGEELAARFGLPYAWLLNDLEAMAASAAVLSDDETVVLQHGIEQFDGNAAVIAAGTGLGQAYLHRVGSRLIPVPSEAGHADFAARTDREIALLLMLRRDFGRAEVEHVLSGPGLLNLHRFTHGERTCPEIHGLDVVTAPAAISAAALAGACPACGEALDLFVSVYGAEAGNLALRGVTTAGLFIGGGIAPKILPALQDGRFMAAFLDKGPMTDLVSRIPVKVILNEEAGLLGAAVAAQQQVEMPKPATQRPGPKG